MQHLDLGEIAGPVLLYGGPYSNLQATEALFDWADQAGIPPAQRICTGDVVAYCADPLATLAQVRARGGAVVAGNCEVQLAAGADACGCGFEAGTPCDLLSKGWYPYAAAQVSPQDRDWMASCPDLISFRHDGARYGVVHGGLTDRARFIWPGDHQAMAQEWAAVEAAIGPVDALITGHSGIAFQERLTQGWWINAGVIGMPPHDGRPATRFALLNGGEVMIHRLTYDVGAAQAAMTNAGLTQGYHTALSTGVWPSEDVLPARLRR